MAKPTRSASTSSQLDSVLACGSVLQFNLACCLCLHNRESLVLHKHNAAAVYLLENGRHCENRSGYQPTVIQHHQNWVYQVGQCIP